MELEGWLRADLAQFKPYASARKTAGTRGVLLNANESAVAFEDRGLNRYPEPQPAALIDALAAFYRVEPEQILVGRGSDEAIDLLTRASCRPGVDAVLIMPPTFGMYRVAAHLQGARVLEVPLVHGDQPYLIDLPQVLERIAHERPKLVYVCAPNNPSGGMPDAVVIDTLLAATRDLATVVVVDEAYIDYADVASASERLHQAPNLVVLRTLSKAHGLAAARIGCALAHPTLISTLRALMAPYPLPTPSVDAALAALTPSRLARVAAEVASVRSERARLAAALARSPEVIEVLPSAANFIGVRVLAPDRVLAAASARGIVIRDVRASSGIADLLRITVGTAAENDLLIEALADISGARAA